MVELKSDGLVFTFPEVHRDAQLHIGFQRTLRIPDDGREYALPPGLGRFPLRHVDDSADGIPEAWRRHGGVLLPMYQSEALWIHFISTTGYPFAVKVATGKVNAITGHSWNDRLHRDPQDYLAVPDQPWLDGYCVEKGVIRQFVAMPLGSGYSAEEQLTREAEHGGIQLVVYPLKAEVWRRTRRIALGDSDMLCMSMPMLRDAIPDMGLAPGGRMTQDIYDDERPFDDWDTRHRSRCFVHLANSLVWQAITGGAPPEPPPTAEAYTRAGLPWFDYYDAERSALEGASRLGRLKSVSTLGKKKGEVPLPENTSVDPQEVEKLRPHERRKVREGLF